ncbi:MAG: sulfite exporter TauE/SafE family protein, partial [Candidatus Helarchaeota archaeon]
GLLLGIAAGFVGASAVSIVVPVLYIFFMFDILMALGTSLLVDVIGASVIAALYWKKGNVDVKMGVRLGAISFTFAIIGAIIAFYIANYSENILTSFFGWFNIILGVMLIQDGGRSALKERKSKKEEYCNKNDLNNDCNNKNCENSENNQENEEIDTDGIQIMGGLGIKGGNKIAQWIEKLDRPYKISILIAISMMIGINAGIFGAGGGFMITIILIYLMNYHPLKAVGTATFMMVLTASGAFIAYFIRFGVILGPEIQIQCVLFAVVIGICSICGGSLGTHIAHKMSENYLKIVLGSIIIMFAVIMIV